MTEPGTPPIPLRLDDQALFLDIDGTLIEHQPHPEGVSADDDMRRRLMGAQAAFGGAIAFVTGRSIEMVDRVFAPLLLPAAGLYGMEHRLEGVQVEPAAEPADLAAVADALERQFHTTQGIYFERKGPVLAVHTRAAPAVLPEVRAAAEEALSRLPEGYRVVVGHAGLEFLPLDALKSAAIERFLQSAPFSGRKPIYIGDDISDEAGFEFVNEVGGTSIRVRPRGPTAAVFSLPDVAAVHAWIDSCLEQAHNERERVDS